MKGKSKRLLIRMDGETFEVTEAKLIVTDRQDYGANKPEIRCKVVRKSNTDDHFVAQFFFQRTPYEGGKYDKRVLGMMDTMKPWVPSYAGHIYIDGVERFEIRTGDFELGRQNKVRVKFAQTVAREQDVGNMHLIAEDECERVVRTLQRLGVFVDLVYGEYSRGDYVDRDLATIAFDRGCNARALKEESENASETASQ